MKITMDKNVGVYREESGLQFAVTKIEELQKEFVYVHLDTQQRKFNFGRSRCVRSIMAQRKSGCAFPDGLSQEK